MTKLKKAINAAVKGFIFIESGRVRYRIPQAKELYKSFPELKGNYREVEAAGDDYADSLRLKLKCAKFNISVKEYKRVEKLTDKAVGTYQTGHSMGSTLALKVNDSYLLTDTSCLSEYSKSCQWGAAHGSLNLAMNKKELKELSYNKDKKQLETNTHYFLVEGNKSNAKIAKIAK